MENNFDVFISYKRDGGSGWAEMLRLALIVYKGIPQERIFMDVHGGCGSDFKEKIKYAISNTTNVIVIFSKDFQNHINIDESKDVWLYELGLAVEHRRSIIPFIVDNIKREDILKLQIPAIIYNILEKNTCIHYNHDMPEGCIKAIAMKNREELLVEIAFTSIEDCSILIPRLGNAPIHYEPINDDNKHSYTAFVDVGYNEELIFIAKRKNESRWNNYRNDPHNIYYEIPKGSMTFDIDVDWEAYDRECLQNNLIDYATIQAGYKPSFDIRVLSSLNNITESI